MQRYVVLIALKQEKRAKICSLTCVSVKHCIVKKVMTNAMEENQKTELVSNAKESFYTVTQRNIETHFENKEVKVETF